MADSDPIQSLQNQVDELKAKVDELSKCQVEGCAGGILSSESFRGEHVVHRHSKVRLSNDEHIYGYDNCLQWFKDRDWAKVGNRIIIDPYDEDNVTPFSYDLSLESKVFSVRDRKRVVRALPYDLQAGETAILLTKQFVALPPIYAATIWPRFSFVLQGVLQSMVKIDPTWYGNIGVGVTNLSPRPFTLEAGSRFGTLILYGLASKTDVNLWHPDQLQDEEVTAPLRGLSELTDVSKKLSDKDEYFRVAWIDGLNLKAKSLKNATYELLKKEHSSPIWQKAVEKVWQDWKIKQKCGARIVPMNALGMTTLEAAVPKGDPGSPVKLSGLKITEKDLQQAAEEYGRPFDLVYGLPSMLETGVRETVSQQIDAELGRTVYPNVVQLVLRIIGVLGLGVGLVGLLIKYMTYSPGEIGKPSPSDMELQRLLVWGIILFGAFVFFLAMTLVPKGRLGWLRSLMARCQELLGEVRTCLSGRVRHRRNRDSAKERER